MDPDMTLLIVAIVAVVAVFILCCAFLGCFEICTRICRPLTPEALSAKRGRNNNDTSSREAQIELYELQHRLQQQQEKQRGNSLSHHPSSSRAADFVLSQRLEEGIQGHVAVNQLLEPSVENNILEGRIKTSNETNEIVVIENQPQQPDKNQSDLEPIHHKEERNVSRNRGISDPEEKLGSSTVWADLRAMEEKRAKKEDHELMDILKGHEEVLRMLRKAKFQINADKYREDKAYRAGVKVLKLAVEKFGFERVHASIHKNEQNNINHTGNGVLSKTNSFRFSQGQETGLRLDIETGRIVGIVGAGDSDFKEIDAARTRNNSDENSSEWYEDGRSKEYPLNKAEIVVDQIRPLDALCGMIACGPPFYLAWTKRGHSVFPLDCRLAVRTCLLIAVRQANQTIQINKQFGLSIGKGILSFHSLLTMDSKSGGTFALDHHRMPNKELVTHHGGSSTTPPTNNHSSLSSSFVHEDIVVGIPISLWLKCCEFLGFNYHENATNTRVDVMGSDTGGKTKSKGGHALDGGINTTGLSKHGADSKNMNMNKTSVETALSRLVYQSVGDDGVNDSHLVSHTSVSHNAHNKMMDVVEEEDDKYTKGVSFSTRDGEDIDTSGRSNRIRNMSGDVAFDNFVLKKKGSSSKLKKIVPPTTPPPVPSSPEQTRTSSFTKGNSIRGNIIEVEASKATTNNTNISTTSPNDKNMKGVGKSPPESVQVSSPRGGSLKTQKVSPTPPPTPIIPPQLQKEKEKEPSSAAHVVLAFLKKAASLPNSEPQVIKLLEGEDSDDGGGSDGDSDGSSEGKETHNRSSHHHRHHHHHHHHHHHQEVKTGDETRVVSDSFRKIASAHTISQYLNNNGNSANNIDTMNNGNVSNNVNSVGNGLNKSGISDEERWLALATEWAGLAKRCLCASDPPSRNLGAQLLTTLHDVSSYIQKPPPRLLTLGRGDEHRLSWLKMWQCPKCTLNNKLLEDLSCPVCGLVQPEGLAHRVALRELLSQWSKNTRSNSNIASSSHHSNLSTNYSRSRTVSISTHQSTGVPSTTGSTNDGENNSGGVRSRSHSNARTVPTNHNAATRSLSSWLAANTSFFPETSTIAPPLQDNTVTSLYQKTVTVASSLSNPSASPVPQPQPTPTTIPPQTQTINPLPKITKLEKKTRTTFL